MKLRLIFIFTILNVFYFALRSEKITINYYHKDSIVHIQQVTNGEPIGILPELKLKSCNKDITIFAGWIAESDITNYHTPSNTTPTFITEEYIPNVDINLYATFADGEISTDSTWQRIKSTNELSDKEKVIIAANGYNYAIGKNINNSERLSAVEITKNEDQSIITPNDDVQIFTLNKISDLLWALQTDNGYLGNKTKENTITYYSAIKDWSSWGITINPSTYSIEFNNCYTSYPHYLYFNKYDTYFACKKTSTANLLIYKQKKTEKVKYIVCTEPDAVEYTITLHDGDSTTEIKYFSGESIEKPKTKQSFDHWQFYGWTTTPISQTTDIPEIIEFPYTPKGNTKLYAVYYATTSDSLIIKDKIIPANWIINETRNYNTIIALYKNDYILIPHIDNITKIEVEMKKDSAAYYSLYIISEVDNKYLVQSTNNVYTKHIFEFNKPISTPIQITSSSSKTTNGVIIKNLTIHHTPIYTTDVQEETRYIVSFDPNTTKEVKKHYSISQRSGGNITLPQNSFIDELDFLEWNTSKDGTGIKYTDASTIKNITSNITLYAQWGIIKQINNSEIFKVDSITQIDRLIIKSNNQHNSGEIQIKKTASLIVKEKTTIEKTIDCNHHHFFSLPYDCYLANITAIDNTNKIVTYATDTTDGEYVIYRYDQTLASQNVNNIDKNAWIEILDQKYILKANQGYIITYFGEQESIKINFPTTETLIITAPFDKTYNLGPNYEWYTNNEKLSNCGWNLIGQPYYETLTQGDLTHYVTIPNIDGQTYTQCTYNEALKQGLITPFSAFFVQLQENLAPTIRTEELDYALYDEKASDFAHIYLSDGKMTDRTSICNNAQLTAEYEIGYDLKKWIGYAEYPQIYTIEKNIPLAYNMQKIDETSALTIGIYTPTEGEYTFSTNKNYTNIYLTDKETNTTTNLTQSNYTTYLSEGTNNDRFEISFQQTTSTQLITNNTKIEYFVQNGTIWIKNSPKNATIYIYDCTGKMIDNTNSDHYTFAHKGLYLISITHNSNNSNSNNNKKFYNFFVIY